MGKKSKKGRTTNKPKHHAAGAGGRKSSGSVASDVLSQSQANSVDGLANKASATNSQKPTTKAPPMNVMVPSQTPEQEPTPTAGEETAEPLKGQEDPNIEASPSSTADSTPEASPSKTAPVIEPTATAPEPTATEEKEQPTSPKEEAVSQPAAAPAVCTEPSAAPAALSIQTVESPRSSGDAGVADAEPKDAAPTPQPPVTPDEVMRSTVSLRDQFEAEETIDGKAVLDVTVDDVALNPLKEDTEKEAAKENLNLSTPSFQEANDVAPQGSECCIIQ